MKKMDPLTGYPLFFFLVAMSVSPYLALPGNGRLQDADEDHQMNRLQCTREKQRMYKKKKKSAKESRCLAFSQ